ncbi:hypothetical protein D9611_003275 [Ephemerocybe angulata]|uniref:Pentatricopeptide repeat-containing protein n=1 Tax=Ephemerocybe angulata TaxID=980116 RepID=A0A8H5FHW3_9AGAR|nr:hypothetical protein D9611_003275 [Tulosesus angulatus]
MLRTILLPRRPSLKLLQLSPLCSTAVYTFLQPRRTGILSPANAHAPSHALSTTGTRCVSTWKRPKYLEIESERLKQLQSILKSWREDGDTATAVRAIQSLRFLHTRFFHGEQLHTFILELVGRKDAMDEYIPDIIRFGSIMGGTLRPYHFESICLFLLKENRWALLQQVAREGLIGQGPSQNMLNLHARSSMEMEDYSWLETILDDFAAADIEPNLLTFRLTITGALRNRDLARAQHTLEAMERYGHSRDASLDALVARTYHHIGADDRVEEMALSGISTLPERTQVGILNSLMLAHLKQGATHRVLRLLSLFEPKSVEIFSSVLHGSGGGQEMDDQPTGLQSLPQPPIPNASTFAIFMHHCALQHRDLSGALQLLQCMISLGIPPSERVIAALVEASFQYGRPELAIQLAAGVSDPATTPMQVFEELYPGSFSGQRFEVHVPGLKPSAALFNALFRNILEDKGLAAANKVFAVMRSNKVQPNEKTLDLLLSHLLHQEGARPRTMIRALHELTGPHLRPTLRSIGFIIQAIQKQVKFQQYGRGWNSLKFSDRHSKPPVPEERMMTVSSEFDLLAGLTPPIFRGYRALMEPFLDDIRKRSIKPDPSTIALRLRHEAVFNLDMDAASEIWDMMLNVGFTPDARHYAAILEGYALVGDPDSAWRVLLAGWKSGVTPNSALYTILIRAHARARDPRGAYLAFQKMVDQGIEPEIGAIDALAGAYYARGSTSRAREVMLEVWKYTGYPLPEDVESLDTLQLSQYLRSLQRRDRQHLKLSQEASRQLDENLKGMYDEWRESIPTAPQPEPWVEIVKHQTPNTYTPELSDSSCTTVQRTIAIL